MLTGAPAAHRSPLRPTQRPHAAPSRTVLTVVTQRPHAPSSRTVLTVVTHRPHAPAPPRRPDSFDWPRASSRSRLRPPSSLLLSIFTVTAFLQGEVAFSVSSLSYLCLSQLCLPLGMPDSTCQNPEGGEPMSGRRPEGPLAAPPRVPPGPQSAGSVSVRHSSGELPCGLAAVCCCQGFWCSPICGFAVISPCGFNSHLCDD